jgi:cysteine peptidase B
MNSAMDWLLTKKDGAIVTEASYPYVSGGGNAPACEPKKGTEGAKIIGHFNVYHSEEQMLAWMESNGPLSLAVDATAWQLYSGGIMTNCGGTQLDHGVLIVGYTATGKTPYWIFKNSWGKSWGEEGYIYIKYGNNQCLLTHYPVSSVVKGSGPAPTPLPNSAYISYEVFDDQGCVDGNQTFVFDAQTCVSWDGVSWKAECSGTDITFSVYHDSLTCTGNPSTVKREAGKCGDDQGDFLYFKYGCHNGQASSLRKSTSHRAAKHLAHGLTKH